MKDTQMQKIRFNVNIFYRYPFLYCLKLIALEKSAINVVVSLCALTFIHLPAIAQKHEKVIRLEPSGDFLRTQDIQEAIDRCAAMGGGVVYFSEGTYISGGLTLKSNVTISLDEGAILQGSSDYVNYKNDAFIFGIGLSSITIQGKGVIDGVDCNNPEGEEGFRGPHAIKLVNCTDISVEGITIKNAGNWALNFRYCSRVDVKGLSIRGGHDGLHARFCSSFKVTNCDFRTGDDAFAGNDNRNFEVARCKINTSCNGFRMGCYNLTVKDCAFWGPGEYMHKIQKRNNMLAAFVHFSPMDEQPKLKSGEWIIKNVTVDNVDHFYMYNFREGLWQTGQPVTSIKFRKIKATGILNAFNIIGDTSKMFRMQVKDSYFNFRDDAVYTDTTFEGAATDSQSFFFAKTFDRIALQKIQIGFSGAHSPVTMKDGNSVVIKKILFTPNSSTKKYELQDIKTVSMFQ